MRGHDLVSDELWASIEPLLPPHPPQPQGGHPWLPDRPALCGIIFVLKTSSQWQMLPTELGCGSGGTCSRRLTAWHGAGVVLAPHGARLDRLGELDQNDLVS